MADFLTKQFSLRESILATLAYFDVLRFPLTLTELGRYLIKQEADLSAVESELAKLVSEGKVKTEEGFYFLNQSDHLAELRLRNYSDYVLPYWKVVRKALKWLRFVPFIRMIAACNNLAINHVNQKSDIDLFFIVDHRYLWLTRFFIVMILSLLGLRHYGKNVAGKLCLSFYITDDYLDISTVAKKPYDIYLNYWVAQIVPVLDESIYCDFLTANLWIKKILPQYPTAFDRSADISRSPWLARGLKKIKEGALSLGIGWLLNRILRFLQLRRIKRSRVITSKHYQDKDVVVSDQMLKFYLNDQRLYFREEFEKHLRNLRII